MTTPSRRGRGGPGGNFGAKARSCTMLKFKNSGSAKVGETLRAKGDAARDRYKWAEAIELYRRHLENEPGDEAIWVQLGNCQKEVGNLGEAERSYLRALSLEPTNADTYVQLGHVEKLNGRPEQALAWYRKALAIDPALESALHEVREAGIAAPFPNAPETSAAAGYGSTEEIEQRLAAMADQIGAIKAVAVELQRLRRHVEGMDAQIQQLQASVATLGEGQATIQDEHLGRLSALEAGAPALQLPFPALLAQLSELNAHRSEIDTCRNRIDAVERKLGAAER